MKKKLIKLICGLFITFPLTVSAHHNNHTSDDTTKTRVITLFTVTHMSHPNPATIMWFGITDSAQVKITTYDKNGKTNGTLLNTHFPPGRHRIEFDETLYELRDTVYFFKLEVKKEERIKKNKKL